MNKLLFLLAFLFFAVSLFAVDIPNRSIYMEGTAELSEHRTFFLNNFSMEASALGFSVTNTKEEAGFTFKFHVESYDDEYDPSMRFIILISLFYNENDMEMVSFGWPFASLNDMYEYNQFVFYRAAVLIPSLSDEELAALAQHVVDDSWRNQRLYLRVSADFPITYFQLLPEGLLGDQALFNEDTNTYSHLDHIVRMMYGATLGVEFQFLSFMSLEANFQVFLGDTRSNMALNMAAGAEIKFPLNFFSNFVIQPYGTFVYTLSSPDAFIDFPSYHIGGGVQIGTRGGRTGAFFIDINYLFAMKNTIMTNPWEHYPIPPQIHYNRFVVGLGVGYKYGLFGRK